MGVAVREAETLRVAGSAQGGGGGEGLPYLHQVHHLVGLRPTILSGPYQKGVDTIKADLAGLTGTYRAAQVG